MSRADVPAAGAADFGPALPAAPPPAQTGGLPGADRRNFWLLVAHQVLFRVGWVFKTESIVMPYFLDMVGGDAKLRSWLMVLNRIGASVPPALYARRLKLMPQKRWSLCATTIGSGLPLAVIAAVWWSGLWREPSGEVAWWVKWFFMAMYGWFFVVTGLNQVSVQTVQGKLVPADRRGRLFTAGVVLGAPLAIAAVAWLMPGWLARSDGGFALLFAAPAVAFTLSGLTMLFIREADDAFAEPRASAWRRLRRVARVARKDPGLRPVALLAMLYSVAMTLFPHYQALARESGAASFDVQSLVTWTVTQHTAVAVASLIAGPMADRFGSRRAVRLSIFGSATAPLVAFLLWWLGRTDAFWLVFVPLGFTPVTNKMLLNYTLEVVEREHHALATAAIGLSLALPVIIGAPLVGALIDAFGGAPVFAVGGVALLAAGFQSLGLKEPRRARL